VGVEGSVRPTKGNSPHNGTCNALGTDGHVKAYRDSEIGYESPQSADSPHPIREVRNSSCVRAACPACPERSRREHSRRLKFATGAHRSPEPAREDVEKCSKSAEGVLR